MKERLGEKKTKIKGKQVIRDKEKGRKEEKKIEKRISFRLA